MLGVLHPHHAGWDVFKLFLYDVISQKTREEIIQTQPLLSLAFMQSLSYIIKDHLLLQKHQLQQQ